MADGTYAVDGMYARSLFGSQVVSTPTRNIVFNSLKGHFVAEAQLENELPYGAKITIYDTSWNLIKELQYLSNIENWATYRFIAGATTTESVDNESDVFVIDDRWIVFPAGYTRNWKNNSWYHYGRSYAFLDLDNLDNLEYDDVNAYGISHTYTNISFIITTDIPRYQFSAENLQVVTVDGKQKLINTQYSSYENDTYVPTVWVHDVETMINAGLSNLGGGVMVESEHSFDVFVGDGTTKQLIKERSDVFGGNYPITVPEGFGPESGTVIGSVPYPVITASTDQLIVSDGYKTEVYEYVAGSWSEPVIVPKSFSGGQLNGSSYFVDGNLYYDFINSPDSFIEYPSTSSFVSPDRQPKMYLPFTSTEPTEYPTGIWPDPLTVATESGRRKLIVNTAGTGNLGSWMTQLVRRTSVTVEYSPNGTYAVKSSDSDGIGTLSSGRWLDGSVGAGESYELFFDLESNSSESNSNISVLLNDTRETITSSGVVSFKCTVEETNLDSDPSIPLETTVVFKSRVKGLSKVSTSEHTITADVNLSGIANPSTDLTDPNVVISMSPGAANEYPDDAFTHFALHIAKPNIPYPSNQQGFTDEELVLDPSTESVEFLIMGSSLAGQQLVLEFGDGWVDKSLQENPLGTVYIDLREDGTQNTIPELVYVANIGAVTGGEDLSVTVSSWFDNVNVTFSKVIPIKIAGGSTGPTEPDDGSTEPTEPDTPPGQNPEVDQV
jgi:hypothetical protein